MDQKTILTLSIIGTAGRGTDYDRLSRATYDRMADIAAVVLEETGARTVVSGGAAWADHLAVRLMADGVITPERLTLHLPAPFAGRRFSDSHHDGETSNRYHDMFRRKTGIDSLGQIADAIAAGARVTVWNGFFDRNRRVAASDSLLAYTYGAGSPWSLETFGNVSAETAGLKDGGTAYTFSASKAAVKIHVTLG